MTTETKESRYTLKLNCGGRIAESKSDDIADGLEKLTPHLVMHSGVLTISNGKRSFGRLLATKMVRQLKNKTWRNIFAKILKVGLGE